MSREQREITIDRGPAGKHRADIRAVDGTIIELQHSAISAEDIAAREKFYGDMIWIFDATAAYEEGRLDIRPNDGYVTFRWKQPRKSISLCRKRVLLDLDDHELLEVRKIHTERPCGGWGRLVSSYELIQQIRGPSPRIAKRDWQRPLDTITNGDRK